MLISSQAYRLPSTATLLLKQWSVPTWKEKKKEKKRKKKKKKKENLRAPVDPRYGQPLDRSDQPENERESSVASSFPCGRHGG